MPHLFVCSPKSRAPIMNLTKLAHFPCNRIMMIMIDTHEVLRPVFCGKITDASQLINGTFVSELAIDFFGARHSGARAARRLLTNTRKSLVDHSRNKLHIKITFTGCRRR